MRRRLHEVFLRWSTGERSPGLWLYGAPAAAAEVLYRTGAFIDRMRHPAPHPLPEDTRLTVVTSPMAGGVGKTPLVAHLARGLATHSRPVIILTRGYGRHHATDITINPGESTADPHQSGDEPLVLAQSAGAPVIVTSDIPAKLSKGQNRNEDTWVVVDDGIRHRWQNETRIAVFAADDLERPIRYLPYGRWRVSPKAMFPVSGVAVTGGEVTDESRSRHRAFLQSIGHHGPVGWYRRVPGPILPLTSGQTRPDNRPFAFCGIGRPHNFLADLTSLGMQPTGHQTYPDHHQYTGTDFRSLCNRAKRAGAAWLLTTHKDAVKVDPNWEQPLPVFFLRISLELAAGDDMLSLILERP